MQAMVLKKIGTALEWTDLPDRQPGPGEIRVKVAACGVCRTDLHVVDGELPRPQVPIIPGHEIVGRIDAIGTGVKGLDVGERVGIPWLGHTCGIAWHTAKISVIAHSSLATRAMEDSQQKPLRTHALRSRSVMLAMMRRLRHCCALGSSAGVRW